MIFFMIIFLAGEHCNGRSSGSARNFEASGDPFCLLFFVHMFCIYFVYFVYLFNFCLVFVLHL